MDAILQYTGNGIEIFDAANGKLVLRESRFLHVLAWLRTHDTVIVDIRYAKLNVPSGGFVRQTRR